MIIIIKFMVINRNCTSVWIRQKLFRRVVNIFPWAFRLSARTLPMNNKMARINKQINLRIISKLYIINMHVCRLAHVYNTLEAAITGCHFLFLFLI